ncbi:MAG TPA: Trk family potassium uptake protein [Nitrospiraceae bacterium]|nr:Trk family potassium uptake protein [Nitrospiraceae bacterium]
MFKNWSPSQVLAAGFFGLIVVGTILLLLPFSSANGYSIGLTDAFFTSVSSVCVTGLIVKDTPNDFSFFGQIVIMVLVQIGGLGYMTSSTIFALILGKKIGLRERLIMKESLNVFSLEGLVRFTKAVIWTTFIIEGIAAVLLALRFSYDFPPLNAIYLGIFHSITAFNNAGFSLFSDNLIQYRGDVSVNIVIMGLIILGGIGFIIFSDIYRYIKGEVVSLSLHTKLTIITTVALILIGTILLFLFEGNNIGTLHGLTIKDKVLASLFHSVSARTAGFNTLDVGQMASDSLFMLIILMVIGASPGSTGGGIKTTTFAIMIVALLSTVRGRQDFTAFGRRLPVDLVAKAFLLTTMVSIIIIVSTTILLLVENKSLIATLFEVASAFGTVGLSVGNGGILSLSAIFSDLGKFFVALTMFAGRLGPLLMSIAIIKGTQTPSYRYPEEKVVIG